MEQDQVMVLAKGLGLNVPEEDLEAVAVQLTTFLQRVAALEPLVGDEEPAFLPGMEGILR